MDKNSYLIKFEKMRSLCQFLEKEDQASIEDIAFRYFLSFQEVRELSEMARDIEMWEEGSIASFWQACEDKVTIKEGEQLQQRKRKLLEQIRRCYLELQKKEKVYPSCFKQKLAAQNLHLKKVKTSNVIYGDCPVCSDRTVCCGLKTIDAVQNCGFACSYCTIQTFYERQASEKCHVITFEDNLKDKLQAIELDPKSFYHFGTGQSSDSLMWGNQFGLLDDLCDFARKHSNILLEFKTKSANVDYFMSHPIPRNVVCSWTLNTETIINNEEHRTASLRERLKAARNVADRGGLVAFHFHPLVFYRGWQDEYAELADSVIKMFSPKEVHFISMGTLTFIKPVVQEIRQRGGRSKILQMEMASDPHGKLTYPDDIKLALFRNLYEAFKAWHDKTFFYLCMEKSEIWDKLWGWHFEKREDFLDKFKITLD